jgi:hypothetical protein
MQEIATQLRRMGFTRGARAGRDAAGAGTLHLVVKSKKVAVRIARVATPLPSLAVPYAQAYTAPKLVLVFDYEFEEDQLRVLSESRELAARTGLKLEVTDLTRQSPLKRLAMRIGGVSRAAPRPASGEAPHSVERLQLRRRWGRSA